MLRRYRLRPLYYPPHTTNTLPLLAAPCGPPGRVRPFASEHPGMDTEPAP